MAPRKKGSKTVPVLEEVPRALRSAIVRVMAEHDLDWEPACEHAAMLIDKDGKNYQKAVKREAERIYKSRFMTQLNLARRSVHSGGYLEGYEAGVLEGRRKYEVWYFCNVCGQRINIPPNSNNHKALIEYMQEHGWGHQACHEKSQ